MAAKDGVVKEALEKFEQSQADSSENRKDYIDDTRFARLGIQWPAEIKELRQKDGRPCLVVNNQPAFIRAVVNEGRQARPSIKVSPVDSGADEDTAEVIGGLIRNVERMSMASIAYDTSLDTCVTGGFGFFRLEIDYAHDRTFDKEVRICRVPNPLSVHWDTSSTAFDASDWDFGFISDMLSKTEYQARYPGKSMSPFEGNVTDDLTQSWHTDESIRIAEYFYRKRIKEKLLSIRYIDPATGEASIAVLLEKELPDYAKGILRAAAEDFQGMSDKDVVERVRAMTQAEFLDEREVDGFEVWRSVVNGVEELEEAKQWPGQNIPICPVWGDEVFIDGKRHFRSLIRDAKDPQMMKNFWRSASTELVALAPRAPFIGPKGFIPKGQETKWKTASTRNHSYLEYDPSAGPPPTRQPFAGVPAGAIQEASMASDDMDDITGIYPAARGAQSNETSGKAILARERQGDISNFHFLDNLNRAITYCGKVLTEVIPAVYGPRETIRILGEDQQEKVVQLTQEDGGTHRPGIDGQPRLYNLNVGKYDVDVKTGPSFATQREETRETLIEIMRAVPDSAQFIGDVLLDHMDFVGADKVAKRLKALLPPEIRQAEDAADNAEDPEKAALVQQNQALQQEMQQVQQAGMEEIEKLKAENDAIRQSKEAEMRRVEIEGEKAAAEIENQREANDLKARQLLLDEAEFAAKPTAEEQWRYEREMEREKRAYEATEAAKDRELELAKVALQKVASDRPEPPPESASEFEYGGAIPLTEQ